MDNFERWKKLQQAEDLIREVEFSYEQHNPIRKAIFSWVAANFSAIAGPDSIGAIKSKIKRESERPPKG